MGEKKRFWVECLKAFFRYKKGEVFEGFVDSSGFHYLILPNGEESLISPPGMLPNSFKYIDPFLVNINKVLE